MFGPLEFAQGPTKLEQLQAQYNIKRVRVSAGINIYHQMGEIGRVRTFFAASGRLVSASHHGFFPDSDFIKSDVLDIVLSRASNLPDNGVNIIYGSGYQSPDDGTIITTDEEGNCLYRVAVKILRRNISMSEFVLKETHEHGLLIPGTSGSPVLGSDGNAIGILQEIDVSGKAFGITFNSPSVANALKRAIDRY
ncbi:MAG: hypothetical protein UV61_C0009G0014 [Candidatus Gottesmanbacteria bacterium GW2011_GWB1_43_11]|uniref:Uncharacterized protein n=1 Tax=Candidatus Gottesmanbacteria bacterium GW2011_GWB1_43_11 TaxID=1618446 RepID=A0A0G1CLV6_9BACT|nr:MAG: hypothetical protein UV17_C0024G0011 [Candidatus Gottesmanbacteria bacterium GW2011_GWA1_42_26]KKS81368.1 MAG: hypothetical protein UV55_C0015G0014 [Candidatus Gottesmanbacteria bacterium GW2011_GWC1_43_10]KKS86487.1 MAG: hypothetical protein UV61_C0009G0014 [Candidatus Gottesmanbacteria bacterium GW2011_GWB1_43_11]OGG10450.1 MAG: hypothetical protein A2699_04405 [Candidatus Gottesmanbacteria bacterium RIFCSPHIGHO2_01_FULL_43_15]OGG28153.1 MAG: hypothetical protein A3A59_03950 [Candidat